MEKFNVIVYKQMITKSDFIELNVVILLFQGLIVASTLFGMATSAIKDQGKVFYNFFYISYTCYITDVTMAYLVS